MGFFYASRRRKITSFSVTSAIIVLIVLVRLLSQPWRGIIDAGVVVGLLWGVISLIIFSLQAFTSKDFSYSPEVPAEDQR
jgi:thiamine transporter ThiT